MWQESALGFSHLQRDCAMGARVAGLWNFQQGGGGLFLEIRVLRLANTSEFPTLTVLEKHKYHETGVKVPKAS